MVILISNKVLGSKRLPRLLLVFWNIFFLEFKTSPYILSFFVTIITRVLKEIFFRAFRPCFIGDCIISGSRATRARVFIFTFLFLKLFLNSFRAFLKVSILPKELFAGLEVLGLWLWLFNSMVFYGSVLSLYLDRHDVNEIITL